MTSAATQKHPEQQIGRYAIFDQIAIGGMARVHLARLTGQEGFSRVVAVKRMHPHLLESEDFKSMFLEEARLAARVRHPNVVPILDVLAAGDELVLVMEYVHGEPLHVLLRASARASRPVPEPVACAIVMGALHGLHAAHEARDESGRLLGIVHRDVSPQNVLVGIDGVARVVDFGVAKAVHSKQETNPGALKGKFSYMAPELIRGGNASRQSDLFSAAVVFWELLTGQKLFRGSTDQERLYAVLSSEYPLPSRFAPHVSSAAEAIAMRGLQPEPAWRYATALEMAIAIESETKPASARVVGEWVASLAAEQLAQRTELIHRVETSSVGAMRESEWPSVHSASVSGVSPVERPAPKPERRPRWFFAAGGAALVAAVGLGMALGSSTEEEAPEKPKAVRAKPGAVEPVVVPKPEKPERAPEPAGSNAVPVPKAEAERAEEPVEPPPPQDSEETEADEPTAEPVPPPVSRAPAVPGAPAPKAPSKNTKASRDYLPDEL